MSRLKRFTRSLLSGYLMLGANVFYTLASVPLALHYLGQAEFGLWALVSQIGGYIALVDLGMAGSVARILIDHKDDRQDGAYGGVIQTGALVGLVQGALVLLAGTVLSLLAGSLLRVPVELRHDFVWLMVGQSAVLGLGFAARILSHLMFAHQRMDICNYGVAVFFLLNLFVMWAGFAGGLGIYSFLVGQAVLTLGTAALNAVACLRLGFLPHRHEWGRITAARFREVFAFGNDIFLVSLGSQLINASQAILLTRLLGLDAAAVWSIGTRTYTLLTQVIFRIFDFSAPAFAEMMVRGEKTLLAERFKQIVIFSLGAAVAAGGLFALCNSAFVTVWTTDRIVWSAAVWPPVNDLLLAVWLVICVAMHAHTGLVGVSKKLKFMRYIFFIEGSAFVLLALAVCRPGGITAMLMASIVCTCLFSLPYGLHRTREYFSLGRRELALWHRPALVLALWLLPAGVLTWWLAGVLSDYLDASLRHSASRTAAWLLKHNLSALLQLVLGGVVFGPWTAWAFLRHGLNPQLQNEMARRLPTWIKSLLPLRLLKPAA
jgi:O-antigen/teichoic acid export membrane protein